LNHSKNRFKTPVQLPAFCYCPKEEAFARKQNMGWQGKYRQLQGAQLSSNEEYLGTAKQ